MNTNRETALGVLRHYLQVDRGNEIDSDNDERDVGVLVPEIAKLLNSDDEDEDFKGFTGD